MGPMGPHDGPPLWDAVLFDLDGTLTDSARGVTESVAAALREIGAPVPDATTLLRFVGPPLRVGFREIAGLTDDDVERAFHAYRAAYTGGGMFRAHVFDDVPALLDGLRQVGMPLALATSKSVDLAHHILEHFGLDSYFAVVAGARPDGSRSAKHQVIDEALRGLADLGHDADHVVMVGDREHDVAGAARWGIPCVLVRWGYGSPDEAEGAYAVVHTVADLAEALGVPLAATGGRDRAGATSALGHWADRDEDGQ